MRSYETLSQAINDANQRGYNEDFNLFKQGIKCSKQGKEYKPEDFEIIETYRFEGNSNPDDNSVLYLIESSDGLKGTLVDAYGAYSEEISFELAEKLRYKPK